MKPHCETPPVVSGLGYPVDIGGLGESKSSTALGWMVPPVSRETKTRTGGLSGPDLSARGL